MWDESRGAIALETELMTALVDTPAGASYDGQARKELAIDTLFRRLGIAESRALAARLESPQPTDALAQAFAALSAQRRGRLLATLRNARRREIAASDAARRAARVASTARPTVFVLRPPARAKP